MAARRGTVAHFADLADLSLREALLDARRGTVTHRATTQEVHIHFDVIVLHGEFALFTVRGNFWYQIYRNQS